jgi:hypothetical protein
VQAVEAGELPFEAIDEPAEAGELPFAAVDGLLGAGELPSSGGRWALEAGELLFEAIDGLFGAGELPFSRLPVDERPGTASLCDASCRMNAVSFGERLRQLRGM